MDGLKVLTCTLIITVQSHTALIVGLKPWPWSSLAQCITGGSPAFDHQPQGYIITDLRNCYTAGHWDNMPSSDPPTALLVKSSCGPQKGSICGQLGRGSFRATDAARSVKKKKGGGGAFWLLWATTKWVLHSHRHTAPFIYITRSPIQLPSPINPKSPLTLPSSCIQEEVVCCHGDRGNV